MKKFVFSLSPLYVMKENAEKQQKMKLKTIETELGNQEQELESYYIENKKIETEFCKAVVLGIDATRAMDYGRYLLNLKNAMDTIKEKKLILEQKKEECLEELISVRKEKMMLDKLSQREYKEYTKSVKKEQNKIVDDFFLHKISISQKG